MTDHDDARWSRYHDAVERAPPHETLRRGLGAWGDRPPGSAVDLGCGAGRDAVALLERGWSVLAIDVSPDGLARLEARREALARDVPGCGALATRLARIEDRGLPPCDWLNAGVSLPFCNLDAFDAAWRDAVAAIRPGGLFTGHLLGPQDGWAADGVVVRTRPEVEAMLAGFHLLWYREQIDEAPTAIGKIKPWHLHHCVARKADEE